MCAPDQASSLLEVRDKGYLQLQSPVFFVIPSSPVDCPFQNPFTVVFHFLYSCLMWFFWKEQVCTCSAVELPSHAAAMFPCYLCIKHGQRSFHHSLNLVCEVKVYFFNLHSWRYGFFPVPFLLFVYSSLTHRVILLKIILESRYVWWFPFFECSLQRVLAALTSKKQQTSTSKSVNSSLNIVTGS